MPLGNLTSQFFANVYLNELDQFVKHTLRAKYYIRYVDDFVIVHSNRAVLEDYKLKIEHFLLDSLKLKLHPDKSKVHNLNQGVGFLGFRLFEQHRRIKKKNVRRFERKLLKLRYKHNVGKIDREKVVEHFEGWLAYITNANTFKYRKHLVRQFNHFFPLEKEIKKEDITKHRNFLQKSTNAELQFSVQKTLQLLNEGKNTSEIAEIRNMGVGTIWKHIVNLIEYNQTSMWKIIGREKAQEILQQISSENETLSDIKAKLFNPRISFDEIECVRAYLKAKNRKKNVQFHVQWYKKLHCMRKCYLNKYQRELCSEKFKIFISGNADLLLKRHDFINLFNDHLTICVLPENEKRMILPWKSVLLMKRYMKEKRKKGVVSSPPF